MQSAAVRLALAFAAGFLAVPMFHQAVLALLYFVGMVPVLPFGMRPTAPLGVPAVVSLSLWGGLWGIAFVLFVRVASGTLSYWLSAFLFGAVAPTLVHAFVVTPLKTGAPPPDLGRVFLIGSLLNGTWGVGTAVLLAIFDRMRRRAISNG